MRRSIVSLVVFAALVVGACASGRTGASDVEPAGPHLTVTAKNVAFDTAELTMTAGQPTLIYFVNQEDAPHNIQIAANVSGGGSMFDGEIISKGALVYNVPAFGAGNYFFLCKVHPTMNGTVKVSP